jgi:hypothetical protein
VWDAIDQVPWIHGNTNTADALKAVSSTSEPILSMLLYSYCITVRYIWMLLFDDLFLGSEELSI